ncbi:MAG: 3-isopropylmalate dehydrogenase [Chromatiales bacterium]
MLKKILVLPGDGIGPEITTQAVKVLHGLPSHSGPEFEIEEALIGGAAVDAAGDPLPEETLAKAQQADAILLGAVGGPEWDALSPKLRPERGLLRLRAGLGLFANLRPAKLYGELINSSSLKPEVIEGLDLVIVRELTGDVYYGEPRGVRTLGGGERQALNTMVYRESEIDRIARVAFKLAVQRRGRVCSVDKANVLETSQLWRQVVADVACEFPGVELTHMYVDNAAMQLVRRPTQFDVLLTPNLFGDILSDLAAMLTGSIGMLPSASVNQSGKGLYEPIHGSAPDIAGQNSANPLGTILSVAMMLHFSLGAPLMAERVERAVANVLRQGVRTQDIAAHGESSAGTGEMGNAVVNALEIGTYVDDRGTQRGVVEG